MRGAKSADFFVSCSILESSLLNADVCMRLLRLALRGRSDNLTSTACAAISTCVVECDCFEMWKGRIKKHRTGVTGRKFSSVRVLTVFPQVTRSIRVVMSCEFVFEHANM